MCRADTCHISDIWNSTLCPWISVLNHLSRMTLDWIRGRRGEPGGGILRPVWLERQRAEGRPPLSSPLTQIPSILLYKDLMIIFFPRNLQHLISPAPPSLLPKWLWVRVWLKSDDDLRRQRSPSTLFGLLHPLSYMRPPKFTYVEYLSFPKALDRASGCADRLQTSVNDQPVRQNLYYLISRSCCTWSKRCKCVGVLISTAAMLLHL